MADQLYPTVAISKHHKAMDVLMTAKYSIHDEEPSHSFTA